MQVTINQPAREAVIIKSGATTLIEIKEASASAITLKAQGPVGPQGPAGHDGTDLIMYYNLSKGQP